MDVDFPEDEIERKNYYPGDYLVPVAKKFVQDKKDELAAVGNDADKIDLQVYCDYAKDYEECVDNTAIIKILSLQLFSELNIFMNGQFDEKKIELSFVPYSNVIFSLVEKYNLS